MNLPEMDEEELFDATSNIQPSVAPSTANKTVSDLIKNKKNNLNETNVIVEEHKVRCETNSTSRTQNCYIIEDVPKISVSNFTNNLYFSPDMASNLQGLTSWLPDPLVNWFCKIMGSQSLDQLKISTLIEMAQTAAKNQTIEQVVEQMLRTLSADQQQSMLKKLAIWVIDSHKAGQSLLDQGYQNNTNSYLTINQKLKLNFNFLRT